MVKSDANECNESLLSNCREQLALLTKEGRDDFRTPFFNGKEGRVGFRKKDIIYLYTFSHNTSDNQKFALRVFTRFTFISSSSQALRVRV